MNYAPTPSQRLIMDQMTHYPEAPKAIAARMPPNVSRQNISMQCRIMADNGLIVKHGRGKFSLKPEKEPITFKSILRDDTDESAPVVNPEPKSKRLRNKFQREEISVDTFAERFPGHLNWLINASNRGNSFAQSLLSQLKRGWMLTAKQMIAVEKNFVPPRIFRP